MYMIGYCYASGLDIAGQPDHAKAGFRPEFWDKSLAKAIKKLKGKFTTDKVLKWEDCSDDKLNRKRLSVNGEKTGWIATKTPTLYGMFMEGLVCEMGSLEEMRIAAEGEAIKDANGSPTRLKWKKSIQSSKGDGRKDLFDGDKLTDYTIAKIF